MTSEKKKVARKGSSYRHPGTGKAVRQPPTMTTVQRKTIPASEQKQFRDVAAPIGSIMDDETTDDYVVTRSRNRVGRQERTKAKTQRKKTAAEKATGNTSTVPPRRVNLPHFELLTNKEKELVEQTTNDALRVLSEDELLELLTRVRRQRDKYSKLHRRQAAEEVEDAGGRGHAARNNRRTLVKAEVFEDALARVTRKAAIVAAQEAKRLKQERLAAVRAVKAGKKPRRTPAGGKVSDVSHRGRVKRPPTPQQIKMGAAARSTQRRNQAAKDARN